MHPQNLEARGLLVRAYGSTGDLGAARRATEEYRKQLAPNDPAADIELGHAYELAHAFEEALDAYDRAAEIAPQSPLGPREGGLRAARWGLAAEADARLREAARRGANDVEFLHARGLVAIRLDQFAEAEVHYRACAKQGAPECHLGLASLGLKKNDYVLALEGFDGVLALRPHDADAALGRSYSLIRLGRARDAEVALNFAASLGASAVHVRKQRALLRGRAEAETSDAGISDDDASQH